MKKLIKNKCLTAEDCNKLAEQSKSNEKENNFWKTVAKMAIKQKDKEIRDEQEKEEMLNCLTNEGESEMSLVLKGNSKAQFSIAELAYDEMNFKEAFKWFWILAQQGNAEAAYYLGIMYANGEYVTMNYQTSLSWHKIAANRGNEDSQKILEDIKKIKLN